MPQIVHVRKQGNVCTVFVDGAGLMPQPMASFDDAPGAPQTFRFPELAQRYPGAQFVFHEEQRPPQPTVGAVDSEFMNRELARMMGQKPSDLTGAPEAPSTPTTPRSLQGTSVPTPPNGQLTLGAAEERLVAAWIEEVTSGNEADPLHLQQLEIIGTFLINALPELEERLRLATAPKPAREKRSFKL